MKKKKKLKSSKSSKSHTSHTTWHRGYIYHILVGLTAFVAIFSFIKMKTAQAVGCTATGFYRDGINMTAALVNPSQTVSGDVNATGCNIGVYYGQNVVGSINKATIHGANYFGVVNQKGNVDVKNSIIQNIGENPLNGTQHGVGIYFATVDSPASGTVCTVGSTSGSIEGNIISDYQKGGIVANCTGTRVRLTGNKVSGQGPVAYIAQNGIQIGYGADAMVRGNTVENNSYTGTSTVSGGIIAVGGPYYGSDYTKGTQIMDNTVTGNDVGVFLTNIAADGNAPSEATNIKVVNNTITNAALNNHYAGSGYQAGVSDVGNNDKIITNTISGAGYDPAANPTAYTVQIDADSSFTNKPKVHANK